LKNEEVYTSAEVAIILGIQRQSVGLYYTKYGIGTMGTLGNGKALFFTEEDIEKIKITDGRKKK